MLRAMGKKAGCELAFSVVPRARQELMFETGRGDLLIAATRTPRRDQHGVFVPMVSSRAMLVSLTTGPSRLPVRHLGELLERHDLRVALVRGYDYGEAYQALIKDLIQQGRLVFAADPVSVARTLADGAADYTILTPTSLIGALQTTPKLRPMLETLHLESVDELPWGESGVYVSGKSTLADVDRAVLLDALEQVSRSGVVWRSFQRYFPGHGLAESVRPR
jgi:polar amino acid transport system substrate-binding protein